MAVGKKHYTALRLRAAAAAVACLAAGAAFAQTADAPPRVLQLVQPESGEEDAELQEILARFLRIELQRAGLSPAGPGSGPERVARDRYGALARGERARFLLAATYTRRGQQVDLLLEWFDADTGRVSAETRRRAPIDLDLDSVVAAAARHLIDQAGARRQRLEPPPQQAASAAGAPPSGLPPAIVVTPAAAAPFHRFEAAIGVTGVFVTGYASDYFKHGFMPAAHAAYRIAIAENALAIGVSAGYSVFVTEGDFEEAGIEAAPVGIDLRYEMVSGRSTLFYLRVGGGPALLRFKPLGGDWLTKVVPFGVAGIGVGIPVSPSLGISVEAGYTLYLEEEHPLSGFTPSIASTMRWGR